MPPDHAPLIATAVSSKELTFTHTGGASAEAAYVPSESDQEPAVTVNVPAPGTTTVSFTLSPEFPAIIQVAAS